MNVAIPLYVRMRDSIERVWFGMINGFAVDILPEKSYVDRLVWYILSMEPRGVPAQSKPVAIISVINDKERTQGVYVVLVEKASKDLRKKDLILDGAACQLEWPYR